MTIFTIGDPEIYRPELKNNPNLKKIGKKKLENDEEYPGGIVFKTVEEAKQIIKQYRPTYQVYSLDGDWNSDTVYLNEEEGTYHIIPSLRIIKEIY